MSTLKTKKILFIPLILIIISIVTSVIAFQQSKKLELGDLYIDNQEETTIYPGEYFAIIGNIDYDAYYISVETLDNYIKIVTYDEFETIQKEFSLVISKKDQEYNPDIVSSLVSNEIVYIDTMEDYLFRVNLEADETYTFNLDRLDSNPDTNNITVVLVNMPENIYNMKTLMESVSFTTLVFAVVSAFTIVAIYFIKKGRD